MNASVSRTMIPNPTDGPYPWILMSRKDLLDSAGLTAPKTIDELYEIGKKVTDPAKGTLGNGPAAAPSHRSG